MNVLRACLFVAVVALAVPHTALAWWNDDWAFRKQITLDLSPAGGDIAGSPLDVPVLVRLHPGNFTYFNDVQPDGDDLRFVAADDATPLKHHVERFDAVNQMVLVWVRVPRLAGGTNTDFVYLYYGNPEAPAANDAAGTYDANEVLVYHFSDANGIARDSTAYGNHPEQFSAELVPASLIAGGARFNGTQTIKVQDSPTSRVLPSQGVTISAWLRFDAPQQDAYVVSAEDTVGRALVLGLNGASPYVRIANAGVTTPLLAGPEVPLGEWHHVAFSAVAGRLNLFVDGQVVASAEGEIPEIGAPFAVGQSAAGANGYVGEIDELQVSNTARSADWLKAASVIQGMTGGLVGYGGDAQRESGGGGESYFATTLRNVTVDGWVVVVILAIMFVVSVFVIVGKAVLLSRIERENRRFLADYRRLGTGDPLSLSSGAGVEGSDSPNTVAGELSAYQPSTLFPLYAAGVNEVRHRLRSPQRSGFTAETMGAIRATVDAVFVRERQKLNARMVLLTIAISGGPFLGLLGTVVGVMVTFAAIAASGDVNVNAIAPGIAAALVATVAGLGVAIPALFAYNWLGSRIKDVDAETHVFGDEFVNKLAEHYA
jgi:biopolymer transport protein ExbB